jgi:hypothetical protein
LQPGQTARQVARQALAAAGIEATGEESLIGLYAAEPRTDAGQVALYLMRNVALTSLSRETLSGCFFALDDLPANITPDTRQRILAALAGKAAAETVGR